MRVFLIDDEAWVLISLERLIAWDELGYTIAGKFDQAGHAWEQIIKDPPDVIITDIRMPGMSGLELLKKIREENLDIQVVLISGFADFQYAQEAIRLGAFEYLLKQVKKEQLTDCMKRLASYLNRKNAKAKEEEKEREETGKGNREKSKSESDKDLNQETKEITFDGAERRSISEKTSPSRKRSVSELVSQRIEHDLKNTPTLTEIGRVMSMSQSSLSQIIKKETGKTYSELVLDFRMQKARELLEDTEDTIVKIADETGFSDQFYFSKTFKRVHGISPNSYRKQKNNMGNTTDYH